MPQCVGAFESSFVRAFFRRCSRLGAAAAAPPPAAGDFSRAIELVATRRDTLCIRACADPLRSRPAVAAAASAAADAAGAAGARKVEQRMSPEGK